MTWIYSRSVKNWDVYNFRCGYSCFVFYYKLNMFKNMPRSCCKVYGRNWSARLTGLASVSYKQPLHLISISKASVFFCTPYTYIHQLYSRHGKSSVIIIKIKILKKTEGQRNLNTVSPDCRVEIRTIVWRRKVSITRY